MERGAFASILLEHHEARLEDRRDVALLHQLVLGVLRRRSLLDHVIDQVSSRATASVDLTVRVLLRLGVYGLLYLDRVPDFATVNSAVELSKTSGHGRASGFINGVLRAVARRRDELLPPAPGEGDVAALALFHSHPRWWVERALERWGWRRTAAILAANNAPVASVICANTRRIDSERLARELQAEGIETRACRFVPEALRVVSGSPSRSRQLGRGRAWVQDEASQLVTGLLGPPGRHRVLDLCAAPGGKTMQLAQRLDGRGLLVAVDRHRGRLRRLARLARRLGTEEALTVQADATRPLPFGTRFDRVLVDAPCSGSGTFRGHPEIRWRLQEGDLERLAQRQLELLRSAADLTAPGGLVVYSVCSMEPEEGEQVVLRFLRSRAAFRVADARRALAPQCAELVDDRGFLRTCPLDDGMDGFFGALLARIPPE